MEINDAMFVLRQLAEGVDPETGEIYPSGSPYQNPHTIRALIAAIDHLQAFQSQIRERKSLPPRAGEKWVQSESALLLKGYHSGKSILKLAEKHQRTYGSIKSQLQKLGIVLAESGVNDQPQQTPKTLQEAEDLIQKGLKYYKGESVPRDYIRALEYLKKSAHWGHAKAQYYLGCIYELGQGVPRNPTEACKWYQLAARQWAAPAQFRLGIMFAKGCGVPQNFITAALLCTRAAKQLCLLNEKDEKEEEEFIRKAKADAAEWYFMRGEGERIPQDDDLSPCRLIKLAEEGESFAQYSLGIKYRGFNYKYSEGIGRDSNKAFYWLNKAAKQGHDQAQLILSIMYTEGQGTDPDYEKAAQGYLAVARSSAMFQMEEFLFYGDYLLDPSLSEEITDITCKAQIDDLIEYVNGECDDIQAFKMLNMAEELKHPHAQYESGKMFEFGQGVRQGDQIDSVEPDSEIPF